MEAPSKRRIRTLALSVALLCCTSVASVCVLGILAPHPQRAADLTLVASAPPMAAPTGSCDEGWDELRAGLRHLRSGEAPDRERLIALAAEIEETCGRSDATRATRHLTSLSPAEAYAAELAFKRVGEALDDYESAAGSLHASRRTETLRDLEALSLDLDLLVDPLPAAYTRRVLAELHLSRDEGADPTQAAALAELALGTYESVGLYEQEVEALEVLARARLLGADLSSAREEATRGLKLAREIEDVLYESRCLRVLVRIADQTGASLDRERLLREWGQLSQISDVEEWWAWTRQTVAWHIDEDQPEQALTFLQGSMTRRRGASGIDPLGSPSLRRQARSLEVRILIRAHEFDRAAELLDQGNTYNDRSRLLRAHLNLRRLASADEGEVDDLLADLAVLLDEDWIAGLPRELLDEGDIYKGEYHLYRGEAELARAALERAVARVIARERGLAQTSALLETSSLGGEALGLHAVQLLARTYLALDRPLLAARISEEMQARTLRQRGVSLDESDLLAWAVNNELGLLTWVIGPDEGVAIWVGPDAETSSLLISHGRRTIHRAVSRLRQALRDEREEDAQSYGLELARELIPAPLMERFAAKRGESVLFLAHGPLEPLPMSALRIPTSDAGADALLAEAVTLRILPGLPAPRPGESAARSLEWVLAGAPTGTDGHTRLPAALKELEEISARRSCDLLIGEELDRAAMISAIEDDACLHIATHVEWVDTNIGPSPALELADGELLTVGDLPAKLGSRELVVLAGCESAGGRVLDGEGVLGFTRAFLGSGTRGVVATLWPVGDETAREFGVALHESLLAQRSPATAVREAGQQLREAGVADWAAFQLLGRD